MAVSFRVRAFHSWGDRTVNGRARARGDTADEPQLPLVLTTLLRQLIGT